MPPFLLIQFFSADDFFLVPICLIFLYVILRSRANGQKDVHVRKLYFQAFYFKIICVLVFTFVTEFYFGGGDTGLYYQGIKDLRAALSDDANNAYTIIESSFVTKENPLAPYFMYDNYVFDYTFNYMKATGNFFIPRLGVIPSLIFNNSYICIAACFAFFALGGALRLFKTFYYFYPALRRELALAILFLPSVSFWSAGLLKDTICFGCVGFIVYAVFNIFIRKTKYAGSIFWLIVAGFLLYSIKTYIFLVLVLALSIWIFAESNKLIKDKTLRKVFAMMTFTVGLGISFFLVQYFTSADALKQYQFENIVSSAEYQRSNYEALDQQLNQQTSYYNVNTSNPFLLIVNSIVATFFRPFIWEVKSAAAVLSALEALLFLLLTVHLIFSKKKSSTLKVIFNDPRILMCFIFAIIFSVGVGASTANFGALSRYKIPCLPFYMLVLVLSYRSTGLAYPKWFSRILRQTAKK
ncbi:MAG: hypothetical protein JWM28_451 [Chitinophagaceae bacterium]|nr:hypothetical protein [Chitinophagaceae bacterium]